MTKKHFIALADFIRGANSDNRPFSEENLETLARFCSTQNPRFNRGRWLGYIHGTNGANGGKVKPRTLKDTDIMQDGDEYWENGKWNPCVAEDFNEPVANGGYEKVRRP